MAVRVWPSREEWVAKAERSVRTRVSMFERLPADMVFTSLAEDVEAEETARAAAAARPLLTAAIDALKAELPDRPKAGRARTVWFLELADDRCDTAGDLAVLEVIRRDVARSAKAGGWRGVQWNLARIRKSYPAVTLTPALNAALDRLDALAAAVDERRRIEAKRLEDEAVAREVARRVTDEAWAKELQWRVGVDSPRVIRI